jgi:predicted alpha/beta superfamily hydrolase
MTALAVVVSFIACGGSSSDGSNGAPAKNDGGLLDGSVADNDAGDAGHANDASTPGDAAAPTAATLRIHYPAGGHAITIRGSAGGLNWTTGVATKSAGSDVFEYQATGLTASIEWKPLLDDTTWARGPNYHLAPGTTLDVYPHFTTITGTVETLIADFHSTTLSNDRAIYAYLPPSYAENTDATYPVVYMHDGQNLWAALPNIAFGATWNVDTTFDAAAENGACSSSTVEGWGAQPLGAAPTMCTGDGDCGAGGSCVTFPEAIVIGVANTANRIYEYTPTTDPSTPGGGGADLYLTMLVTELKPAIDAQLRTRPDVASTSLAGSSLGGLVTAYAGLKYPNVFGRLGELSPSTWWNADVIVGDVQGTLAAPHRPAIVYVDSGSGTADDEADTDMLAQEYLTLGYVDGTNFRHVIQSGAAHNETYWAERLPGALQLMLGAR